MSTPGPYPPPVAAKRVPRPPLGQSAARHTAPRTWAGPARAAMVMLLLVAIVGLFRLIPNETSMGMAHGDVAARGAGPRVGLFAPDFSALDLEGQPVQLSALRGRPVWINFWTTWCPACKAEMPDMETLYQRYQAQGLVILGIDLQEDPAVVRAWVRDRYHWRFVIDARGTLANQYRVEGLPTHAFVDRAGVIRDYTIGQLRPAQMEAKLALILAP